MKLARISSGETTIGVDVSDGDIGAAGKACEAEFDRLCKKYPRVNGS